MGLINDKQQAPQETEAMPQGEAPTRGNEMTEAAAGEAPTPEEQKAYEAIVSAAAALLHSQETLPGVVQVLQQSAQNPAEALSETVVTVIQEVDSQAQGKLPREVILPAAGEVLSEVITIADASGAIPEDQAVTEEAWQLVVQKLAKAYKATPEEAQEFMGSVDVEGAKQAMAKPQQPEAEVA
jgi:hypothetical protein